MNRHSRIAHLCGDYTLLTARRVLEELEFTSLQEAMRWLINEFVNIKLDWHDLRVGSPYPIGLPNLVRSIEQALCTSLEQEIGTSWGDFSSSQRQIADHNFRRIFGAPELLQGPNSDFCLHKFERWLVFREDGLAALDTSKQDIRARAFAIRDVQDQIAQRRMLAERVEFSDHFSAQVDALREEMGQLTPSALAKALASTFFEQRQRIRCYILDISADNHGIYHDLVRACPATAELIHTAMGIALDTKSLALAATLLLIVWGRPPTWPALVEAGLVHPEMARILEGHEPHAARWWRSVVRGHAHEARLVSHGEYNRRRAHFLSELAPLTSVERLRRILVDGKWHLGALPREYADPAALDGLSQTERAALRLRLMRAPSGCWSKLKARA